MSGNENENQDNSSSNKTETVTISSNDPKKILQLEKQLAEKQQELNQVKQKAGIEISNLKKEAQIKGQDSKPQEAKKENLGTRNNIVNGPGYNNAYEDGRYEKAVKKLREKEELAKRGIVGKKN